jgi:hypothetical protein
LHLFLRQAYQAFDRRQPGWIKVDLQPALVAGGV